ncbi:linear amide C-N hydrolase [Desulfohalovibrio reitneri]|uniref:linear amide C-N hydrolase n=1 Tax=Desulfohalovibrio reitneri TaxID=1307759 RepID=UPI0009DFD622|nr:choloylglycine hydrolase family protein [Desulfohalovibrio reitneri]
MPGISLRNLTLMVVLAVSTVLLPSAAAEACTGVRLVGEDGAVVFGRTQEWGKFDLKPRMAVVPRGTTFQGQTPDGSNGLSFETKYGLAGVLLMQRVIGTGMNEKGLAGGQFYHEGFAEYAEYDPDKAGKSIAPTQVLRYILANFASLEEAREGLREVRVVATRDKDLGKVAPLHYMVVELGGESMVIEYMDGKPVFHHNPVGVITNNPYFDWHLTNLRNYGSMSTKPFKAKKWGDLEITPLAAGSGMLGLPGDFTSPSRFVRATVFAQTARQTSGGLDTAREVFRILDSFQLPADMSEGSDTGKKVSLPSGTQYTIANDTANRVIYYHTMYNRRLRKLDLTEIDFGRDGTRAVPLDEQRAEDIKEVTGTLR